MEIRRPPELTESSPRSTHSVTLAARVHARLASLGTNLPVTLWDGTRLGPREAPFRLVLNSPASLRQILVPGTDLAIGEAYLDDAFDVEGSMVQAMRVASAVDLDGLGAIGRLALSADVLRLPSAGPHAVTVSKSRFRRRGRAHTLRADREAVRHHYDVSNDFYRLFLDRQLVYSCAYFSEQHDGLPEVVGREALEIAQQRKLELICRKLRLQPDDRLLDIGCGWGALVVHAARHHGVKAVGITLSHLQADYARARVAEAGLAGRVEIRVQDYREVTGSYDAVASVGMVEHVGVDHLDEYFRGVRSLLGDGGRLLNHGITTGARGEARDFSRAKGSFIAKHVFPDGGLVPTATMVRHAEEAGFEVLDVEQFRRHYARTLQHWVARLEASAHEATELVGDRIHRTWRAYMAGSVVGFESNDLGVVQILAGTNRSAAPLGRDWMTLG